ncbi:transglutaminase-like domain-containing protein [Paenibacillus sp. Z6-24]
MKKLLLTCLTTLSLFAATPVSVFAAESSNWLDTSNANQGYVAVHYEAPSNTRTKVMITKNDTSYTYNLNSSRADTSLPLQLGSGTYQVSVLENTAGNNYKKVYSDSLQVQLSSENSVYLASTQNIDWKNSPAVTSLAAKLTQNAITDQQKAQAIYNYITANIKYDYQLAGTLPTVYIPDPQQTLSSRKGICYDYASLNAAMLRSQGIPAKLVMGTASAVKEYHAWNEVYLNGKWVTVDATVDASLQQNGKQVPFAKDAAKYHTSKVY